MNFKDYMDSIKDVPISDKLQYHLAVIWLHPGRLPIGVVSLGDETMPVIKLPARAVNPHGHDEKHIVPVIAVGKNVFRGKDFITDIILPSSVSEIAPGAFAYRHGSEGILPGFGAVMMLGGRQFDENEYCFFGGGVVQ